MKKYITAGLIFLSVLASAQQSLLPLTVEKIMRDPKWMGTQPSAPYWSADSKYLFFSWNPEGAAADSLYYISSTDRTPKKTTAAFRQQYALAGNTAYNSNYTAYSFIKNGDLFYVDKGGERRVTQTTEAETAPQFIDGGKKLIYSRAQNIYAWDIARGATIQLTNFVRGTAPKEAPLNAQEKWLGADAVRMSEVLKERKEKKEAGEKITKALKEPELRTIYTEEKNIVSLVVSPDARFITYRLIKPAANPKNTVIPSYVTESGFTTDIPGRTKVGAPESSSEFYVFDRLRDTVLLVKTDSIPGIFDAPGFLKDYPVKDTSVRKPAPRPVSVFGLFWNSKGTMALVDVRSADNKDRWLMTLNPSNAKLKLIDRQRDEAWIGGPGMSNFLFNRGQLVWLDDETFWYQSEASGYLHLYTANVNTGEKKALTTGRFEVQSAQLSRSKKYFYLSTNEVHPGEQQFYRMPVGGGKMERITTMTGANQVSISPDEKYIATLYSFSNKPWELYLQEVKPGSKPQQVTDKAQSAEFRSYAWKDPELVTITARDGAQIYARLYRPTKQLQSKPAVMFVHGAGYLQNAHKWWSFYFREYMFNNLLADAGYTVLDIDYRGSSGYGRDWRTAIYRHMGGKDLSDHVDAAKYLVEKLGVNAANIGLYGGSYGGFITLMALFKEPQVFKSGGALRSVTDWAHYNDGYTSSILNDPFTDSIAYRRSSPIYYAEGLKGNLLMCHGMIDVNVHFQDIVRLTQRLIELGKNNWELAVYPLEDHGFIEPSSWTDQYKRVFKLFDTTLK